MMQSRIVKGEAGILEGAEVGEEALEQADFVLETTDPLDRFAADEEDEGGDAHNLVGHGEVLVVVHIEFDDFDFAMPLLGELGDDGVKLFAGVTPDGGEIHEDGLGGLEDFGGEGGLGKFLDFHWGTSLLRDVPIIPASWGRKGGREVSSFGGHANRPTLDIPHGGNVERRMMDLRQDYAPSSIQTSIYGYILLFALRRTSIPNGNPTTKICSKRPSMSQGMVGAGVGGAALRGVTTMVMTMKTPNPYRRELAMA